jgi:hypothetical protein
MRRKSIFWRHLYKFWKRFMTADICWVLMLSLNLRVMHYASITQDLMFVDPCIIV